MRPMSNSGAPPSLQLLLILLLCPTLCQQLTVLNTPCLDVSTAAWASSARVRSLLDCHIRSRQAAVALQSIGFLQFHRLQLTCALFPYKQVCHLLNLTTLTTSQQRMATSQCECLVDSEFDVLTANAHFAAVWIGGKGPALENLVCGHSGPRNPVWATDVVWTQDGAKMNGATSRMLVNNTAGLNFSADYTVLMRLKRTPGPNAFWELTDCSSLTQCYPLLWEFDYSGSNAWRKLFFNQMRGFQYTTESQVLPTDPDLMFNTAVMSTLTSANILYGCPTIVSPQAVVTTKSDNFTLTGPICLKIGFRDSSFGILNGTVNMLAISNTILSDDTVNRFLTGN